LSIRSPTIEAAAMPKEMWDAKLPSGLRLKLTLVAFIALLLVVLLGMSVFLVSRIFARVAPSMRDDLAWKTRRGAAELAQRSDVAIVSSDLDAIEHALGGYRHEENVLAILVEDAAGKVLFAIGGPPLPPDALFAGPPGAVRDVPGGLVSWAAADIEGNQVGRVALVISTARLEDGERLRRDMLRLAAIGGLAAVLLTLIFVRFYIGPLVAFTEKALRGWRQLAQTLEQRVADRTEALSQAHGELRQSFERVQQVQGELVAASRVMGMAEVATSVLHNVGNVLNSVNVSGNMVMDTLRHSKARGLVKVAELLRGQPDPAAFLRDTERGQRLPEYLLKLADAVTDEQKRMLGEIQTLTANVDHVKAIISLQQGHARMRGTSELMSLAELMGDAVRFDQLSCQRQGIELTCDFAELPPILVDRHRLLQIVLNLLSNARQALRNVSGVKRIAVRLFRTDEANACITVTDTGVGIAPENMPNLFRHGFTTKKDGHGFGLHSSAIAAHEMGGSLTCASEGVGRGATFTLTFPLDGPPARDVDAAGDRGAA
jgi:signal transduction histidine kinase